MIPHDTWLLIGLAEDTQDPSVDNKADGKIAYTSSFEILWQGNWM